MSHAEDVVELVQLVNKLFRAADERDWGTYRSLLADDVEIWFPKQIGSHYVANETITADRYTAENKAAVDLLELTQHFITSHVVEIDGDTAKITYNEIAFHSHPPLSDDPAVSTWTAYADGWRKAVRTSAGWRISGTGLVTRYETGNPQMMGQIADAARTDTAST